MTGTDSPRKPGRPANQELQDRRREEILGETMKFFAEHGYPQGDVQILVDRLQCGKGTIYRYFPTKEDLFRGCLDYGVELIRAQVRPVEETDRPAIETVAEVITAVLRAFAEHPEIPELFIQERAAFGTGVQPRFLQNREQKRAPLRRLVERLQSEQVFRNDLTADRIMDVVAHMIYGTVFLNSFSGKRSMDDQQANDLIAVLFSGILRNGGNVI